jgi:two-component sensor histidine kinase/PAS domain-containing protein
LDIKFTLNAFNKIIYLIHVGNDNPAIKEMFNVKWLSPCLRTFTFKNEADFLMYYNVNSYAGCSYAAKNKGSIMENFKFKQKIDSKEDSLHLGFENTEAEMVQHIIGKLPVHIYWLNRKNVYLGCNEVQAKDFGLKLAKEVVGKTNFDFHEESVANEINKVNELVMSTGKPYEGEEPAYIKGQIANCLSSKIPILNIHGKCIGLLGVSFDITDRKEKEELQNKLKTQEELYNVAKWVAHDIAQPVTVLKGYLDLNKSLGKEEKRIFEESARRIENIAERLLLKYRGGKDVAESDYVLVSWCLEHVINQKREQYKRLNVDFKCEFDNLNKFEFIKGNFIDFNRMVCNLVNNGVEAIEEKEVKIEVSYGVKGEEVEIRVKDNGKGMPKEVVERIMNDEKIGTTKEEGHGIGMQQIMSTIRAMKGKIKVESKEGEGTECILTFPKAEKPKWFKDKIEVKKGDTVVILDDEELMHNYMEREIEEV